MTTQRKERIDRGIRVRSDDVFVVANYRDVAYLILPRLLPVIIILLLPLILPVYWIHAIVMVAVYAILAMSWDFIHSAGMISLGHSFIFGVGGYSAAALNHYLSLPPWLSIPLGTIIGAVICTALLSTVLRLRGIYFGMVTFALAMIAVRLIEATRILGGTEGLSGLTPFPNIWVEVYLPLVVMFAVLFIYRRLIDTNFGTVLRGINENDRSVMSSGINVYWYKTQALFIGSLAAAFAGAFMVHYIQIAGMSLFALDYSLLPVTCVIVGGMGNFAGAILGSFLLVPISEFMRNFGVWRTVFYCTILIIFVVAIPEGVLHYIRRRYQQFERKVAVEAVK
jgi:branched-chain amino acid transport system permease protein